jgi:hypothetical protein
LLVETINNSEIKVFNNAGEFREEFISYVKKF